MKLALQDCGRKLGTYLRKRQKIRREGQRRDVFARYIGEVAKALHVINAELDPSEIYDNLKAVAESKTELADQQLDDEGKAVKKKEKADDTIVIDDSFLDDGADDAPAARSSDDDSDDATLFEK